MKIILFLLITFSTIKIIAQNKYVDTSKLKECNYTVLNFPNDKKREEGCLIKDKREGVWKEYFENKLLFTWTYKQNIKNGPYFYYNDKGAITAKGKYKEGLLSDTLLYYDDNGKLIKEEVWAADFKSKSSKLISHKNYSSNTKSDNTIEVINGKKYLWIKGEKHELILNDSINKIKKRTK